MTDNSKNIKDSVKDSVLERLEREGITPRSRWYWLTYEYSFWGAWLLSVVLGAVALAVLSFTSLYIGYSLYEATHAGFATYLLDVLPYLWLVAFAGLTLIAHFNLRNTKRGYKYPLYLVVGSSFGFSVIGAMVLHYVGAGYYLDRYLGENLESYHSRVEFETLAWQNPMAGRLLGQVEPSGMVSKQVVVFTDIKQEKWPMLTEELRELDTELLLSGKKVRVLVATTSMNIEDGFVACAVFPWELDDAPALVRLRDNRQQFLSDIRERRELVKEIVAEVKEAVEGEEVLVPARPATSTPSEEVVEKAGQSPCSNHSIFRRKL